MLGTQFRRGMNEPRPKVGAALLHHPPARRRYWFEHGLAVVLGRSQHDVIREGERAERFQCVEQHAAMQMCGPRGAEFLGQPRLATAWQVPTCAPTRSHQREHA